MGRQRGPKKILMQRGFNFPPGPLFSDRQTVQLILTAIFGTELSWAENHDMVALSREAEACLLGIFHTLVDRADLYGTLRGHSAFYATVASELNTRGELTGDALKDLDELYVRARRGDPGEWRDTDLNLAVDAWISVKDAIATLPPLETLSLTARTNEMGALVAQFQATSVAGPAQNVPDWPPTHFGPYELALITTPELRSVLFGKTHQTPGTLPALPSKTTMPLETRAHLCSLALANYRPSSNWNLILTPVANFNGFLERRQWSIPSGGQSLYCFTIEHALVQAVKALESGKVLSIVLATPWFGRTWGAIPSVTEVPGAESQQSYADGIELIIFDPTARYTHIKTDPQVKTSLFGLFNFRQSIRDNTELAMQRAGGRLIRGWYGGKMDTPANGSDSVQLASEWIRLLVLASSDGQDPLAVDDEKWAQWGFEEVHI
ncbi:hypothetical protein CORC01_07120 [Colletotrichum orchidophilum]|uniref:Uncharacterized protein n=1 Tax=Colletotrichum orchidophilum TaxID=1209926 RepID=A0A1G4B8B0_9PEZI|nr:uncharacterized protein CORC01_07120 [Colletotrichum orchidophilum]OHE97505.1 hypothetical protein CORC01_07120 [Colletotrichum orchidophilum]